MKKLLALYRKFRAGVAVNSSKHPVLMALLFLVLVNLLIIFGATFIIMYIDSGTFTTFFSAFLAACEWLVFPASALNAKNNASVVVAIIVAVSGMILFTGTVIALTTNYLRAYISQKTEGGGKLPLNNHIVILNYDSQVLAILTDLMHSGIDKSIIILSDKSRDFIRNEIAGELAELKNKPKTNLKLIVRKGNPFSAAELSDINIEGASSILIMDDESSMAQQSSISAADYDTIKLLLKLSSFNIPRSCPIVVEAESYETAEIIRHMQQNVKGLKDKSIEAFSYNRKLGQFLALSILYPSMTDVLYHLLSFSGPVFYPVAAASIESYLHKYTGSIPVITLDNSTIVLTQDIKHLKQQRAKPYNTRRKLTPLCIRPQQKPVNLFVIGENQKHEHMLEFVKAQNHNVNINMFKSGQIDEFILALSGAKDNTYDNVAVVLSEDTSPHNRDQNVILTLIELNRNFGTHNRPFKIVAEILEPKNQEAIEQFNIQNIIVSSRIISFFVTKLITGVGVDEFYEDVFIHSISGKESPFTLCIENADELFDHSVRLQFHSFAELVMSVYHGSLKKMMPLGAVRDGQIIYFCTDMDKREAFTLQESDKLIYIAYND